LNLQKVGDLIFSPDLSRFSDSYVLHGLRDGGLGERGNGDGVFGERGGGDGTFIQDSYQF
jgi:hypothetical protein